MLCITDLSPATTRVKKMNYPTPPTTYIIVPNVMRAPSSIRIKIWIIELHFCSLFKPLKPQDEIGTRGSRKGPPTPKLQNAVNKMKRSTITKQHIGFSSPTIPPKNRRKNRNEENPGIPVFLEQVPQCEARRKEKRSRRLPPADRAAWRTDSESILLCPSLSWPPPLPSFPLCSPFSPPQASPHRSPPTFPLSTVSSPSLRTPSQNLFRFV